MGWLVLILEGLKLMNILVGDVLIVCFNCCVVLGSVLLGIGDCVMCNVILGLVGEVICICVELGLEIIGCVD